MHKRIPGNFEIYNYENKKTQYIDFTLLMNLYIVLFTKVKLNEGAYQTTKMSKTQIFLRLMSFV